jgi:hypothetical protein
MVELRRKVAGFTSVLSNKVGTSSDLSTSRISEAETSNLLRASKWAVTNALHDPRGILLPLPDLALPDFSIYSPPHFSPSCHRVKDGPKRCAGTSTNSSRSNNSTRDPIRPVRMHRRISVRRRLSTAGVLCFPRLFDLFV